MTTRTCSSYLEGDWLAELWKACRVPIGSDVVVCALFETCDHWDGVRLPEFLLHLRPRFSLIGAGRFCPELYSYWRDWTLSEIPERTNWWEKFDRF